MSKIMEPTTETALLWIGDFQHPEVAPHWNWLRRRYAIHWRENLADALRHPVSDPSGVLVVRLSRAQGFDTDAWKVLRERHAASRWMMIEGQLCAGASRSGIAPADVPRISTQLDPRQMEGLGLGTVPSEIRPGPRAFAMVDAQSVGWEWLADRWAEQGIIVTRLKVTEYTAARGFTAWIWDEGAIAMLGESKWRTAVRHVAADASAPRQWLLATFPTWDQSMRWRQAGLDGILPKPWVYMDSRWLDAPRSHEVC